MKHLLKVPAIVAFASAVLTLSGCGLHNVPRDNYAFGIKGNKASVYVDQFGKHYPNGWKGELGEPENFGGYSLELRAGARNKQDYLSKQTANQLADFREFIQKKDRLIFFVHGYSSGSEEAVKAYDEIARNIRTSDRDAIIHFFWDGLVSRAPLAGEARIWFYAAGNSHLAGTKGLRPLLAQAKGKEIVIISHSRGAHVVLSAVSNPRVSASFKGDTDRLFKRNMFADAPLPNNGNSIKLLLISPAIGRVDFRKPDPSDNHSYRQLGPQVKVLAHTVNPNDPTLKKYISGLSDNFNSTDFGHDAQLTNELQKSYPFIVHREVKNLKSHSFALNALDPSVRELFVAVGLQLN